MKKLCRRRDSNPQPSDLLHHLASYPSLRLSWPLSDVNRVGPSLEASFSGGPSSGRQQTTLAGSQAFPESVHIERVLDIF